LGNQGNKILFGMISQLEEGQYFLEDIDASVRLDLSNCV